MHKLKRLYKNMTIKSLLLFLVGVTFFYSFVRALQEGDVSKAIWIGLAFFWFVIAQISLKEITAHHKMMDLMGITEQLKSLPSPEEVIKGATFVKTTTFKEFGEALTIAFSKGYTFRGEQVNEVRKYEWETYEEDTILILSTDTHIMFGSGDLLKEKEDIKVYNSALTAQEYEVQSR